MFANIKSGKFSFPSPFWDHVSEEAKVSRPSHLLSMHLKTGQLDFQATQVFNPHPPSSLAFLTQDFIGHLLVVAPQKRYSSSQMLQHSWLRVSIFHINSQYIVNNGRVS